MSDANKRLEEWNTSISEGKALAAKIRENVLKRKDGVVRRLLLRLLRFTERWIERGKRWRSEDLQ